MKAVAVLGATLSVTPDVGSTGLGGDATFVTLPSLKVRASTGVYRGPTTVILAGVTNTAQGGTIPSLPLTGIIDPTAAKTTVEGQAPIREGDKVTIIAVPMKPGAPPTPVPTPMVVEVSTAGQSKVKAA